MNNAKEELTLLIKQFTAGLEHARQQAVTHDSEASTEMPPIQTVDLDAFTNSWYSIDYQLTILQQKLAALLNRNQSGTIN
ncbi:hypothetical protein QMK33_20970 [Hymenobacter sp. H14-R3]|uniref:hypothetical protein n=1 Tax=Hymenobacter sp. H14-R3 TaxID=3046308 RepID=UPI0024BB73B2|nr:hypothetical protein [Hymenobacter sp. H14-R3]MDJ0367626.1 hypothetical protein [Hymenobacter sp. H14-R3]